MLCTCFQEWLNQNPKYSDIVKSKPIPDESHVMKYLFTTYVILYCLIYFLSFNFLKSYYLFFNCVCETQI